MIRLSYGTAVKMGLKRGRMLAEPTTAYIMLGEHCESNCAFCAQRKSNPKRGYLSRILWIPVSKEILKNTRGFARICFQTLDYPEVVDDLLDILPILPDIPVSVSIVPIDGENMKRLKNAGVEIISIALDASTPEIFDRVKGKAVGNRFTWDGHWNSLRNATKIFEGVNTHIIVGLGERDEDIVNVMRKLRDMSITTALFSYTPVNGGAPPDVGRYRAIQLARFLIYHNTNAEIEMKEGKIVRITVPENLKNAVLRGVPFLTSGCPGCNRPFYNERPGGVIYNYPLLPSRDSINNSINELRSYSELTL